MSKLREYESRIAWLKDVIERRNSKGVENEKFNAELNEALAFREGYREATNSPEVKALVEALKGTADGDYPEGDLVPCWCHFRDHEDFCLQARAALAPFNVVQP